MENNTFTAHIPQSDSARLNAVRFGQFELNKTQFAATKLTKKQTR